MLIAPTQGGTFYYSVAQSELSKFVAWRNLKNLLFEDIFLFN